MEKIWRPYIIILVLLILLGSWANGWVFPLFIDRVEVYTYDHKIAGSIELNAIESVVAVTLSYLGVWAGEVNAEPCCDGYRLEVHYWDGTEVYFSEGAWSKLITNRPIGVRHYIWNPLMLEYIKFLANVYELPDPWAN